MLFLIEIARAILDPLHSYVSFISLSIFTKNSAGILIRITSNQLFNLRRFDILQYSVFQFIFLYLFRFSSIRLDALLQFFCVKSYAT